MVSPRPGKDRTTRLLLILLCLLAFGPIMVAALFRIVTIETRNGYRHVKYLVRVRAHLTGVAANDAGKRTTVLRR